MCKYGLSKVIHILTQQGELVDLVYLPQSRDDSNKLKNLMVGYFFSVRHPFDKLKEKFLFIWANKMIALNSSGDVDFTLVAILDTSGYSNEVQ